MHLPDNQLSRSRATVAGAITGMVCATSAAILYVFISSSLHPPQVDNGLTGSSLAFAILPGSLIIGLMFAFPTSAAMVFSLAALSRRMALFDSAWAWIAAGILYMSPTAYLFSNLENTPQQFALVSIWSVLLAIGGFSGLVAWLYRHPKLSPASPGSRSGASLS